VIPSAELKIVSIEPSLQSSVSSSVGTSGGGGRFGFFATSEPCLSEEGFP
jgi:hypothetical protein